MDKKNTNLPKFCPSCEAGLFVTRLQCESCETEVGGRYPLPRLARLSNEDQAFVLEFVETSGSLKEMAKRLGVSYPTVRNRLNDVIARIQQTDDPTPSTDE